MEFKKGDVCLLEVTVVDVLLDGSVTASLTKGGGGMCLHQRHLTLLRRAPVDLATCDLPVKVEFADGARSGMLVARGEKEGWLRYSESNHVTVQLSDIRHLDAPAPTCPPGHIMIGDRAVPEPMREAPDYMEGYWIPALASTHRAIDCCWENHPWDDERLQRGLIHSTEAAARAHAEALIALSTKREG